MSGLGTPSGTKAIQIEDTDKDRADIKPEMDRRKS